MKQYFETKKEAQKAARELRQGSWPAAKAIDCTAYPGSRDGYVVQAIAPCSSPDGSYYPGVYLQDDGIVR